MDNSRYRVRDFIPSRTRLARWIPAIEWIPAYPRDRLPSDIVAGLIVAVMLVPQSMAYAMLAGLPPEVGLYASIVPLIVYGFMGTSKALGVGPTAIASIMTASGLSAVAAEGSSDYLVAALVLTMMVGVIRTAMGLVRAGFLVNFMSRPVLSGFVNAAGLMIAASQAGHLFGLQFPRNDTFFEQATAIISNLPDLNTTTTIIGLVSVGTLLYFQLYGRRHLRFFRLSPDVTALLARTGPLIVVVAVGILTWQMQLHERANVLIVGDVPGGFPPLVVPDIDFALIQALLPSAIVISVVGFMESISIAKSLASRDRERIDPNQELVAVGVANIGAAFTGGYTVTGSFSRSVLNYAAGARSGLASIITGIIVLGAIVFLTPLFFYLPQAVLAAIVIVALTNLFETRTFRRVWSYRRADAITLIITFVAVLVIGIELGIVIGIASAVGLFLWRTSHPAIVELGRVKGTDMYRNKWRYETEEDPRILLLRIDESLYFANTQHLQDHIMGIARDRTEIDHIVLVGSAINDIDASALETLEELVLQLNSAEITVHIAAFKLSVMERLRGTLLRQLIGGARTHPTVNAAVAAINQREEELVSTAEADDRVANSQSED